MAENDSKSPAAERQETDDYERVDVSPFALERSGRVVLFSSNLNKEAHAEFRNKAVEYLPQQREVVNAKIEELLQLLAEVNGLEVLGVSALKLAMSLLVGDETFSAAQLEYLASVVTALPALGTRSPSGIDMQRFFELLHEIQVQTRWYYTYDSMRPTYSRLESHLRFHLLNWTLSVRGESYLVHVRQELAELHGSLDDTFKETLGFTALEFFHYLESLRKTVGERIFQFVGAQQSLLMSASGNEKAAFRELEALVSHFRFADLLKIYEIKPQSETEGAVLKAISCAVGGNSKFLQICNHKGWMLNPTLARESPFVFHDGKYYAFGMQASLYSAPFILQSRIAEAGNRASRIFRKAKEQYVEHEAVMILGRALGANQEQILHNLYFPGGELDGLISIDDAVVLVEVKAGKLRESALRGSYQAFIDDMKGDLLARAFQQTEKALAFIASDEPTVFTDQQGLEVFTLPENENYKFYAVSVYYESIGHILNDMNLLKDLGLVAHVNHWAVNLNDLRCIAELTEHPTYLLHYIERRHVSNDLAFVTACDEMDLYMFHLREGLYIQKPESPKKATLNIGTYTEEADDYFESIYVEDFDVPKPAKELPPKFKMLIEKLEKQRPRHFVSAATFLFDTSTSAKEEIDHGIEECEKRFESDGQPHTLTLLFNDAATVLMLGVSPDQRLTSFFPFWSRKHLGNEQIAVAIAVLWSPTLADHESKVTVYLHKQEQVARCQNS